MVSAEASSQLGVQLKSWALHWFNYSHSNRVKDFIQTFLRRKGGCNGISLIISTAGIVSESTLSFAAYTSVIKWFQLSDFEPYLKLGYKFAMSKRVYFLSENSRASRALPATIQPHLTPTAALPRGLWCPTRHTCWLIKKKPNPICDQNLRKKCVKAQFSQGTLKSFLLSAPKNVSSFQLEKDIPKW